MTPVRIDGHLDLAYNAIAIGRDLTLELDDLRAREQRSRETAMVTWPELRRADVAVVFGTLFAKPDKPREPGAPPASDGAYPGYRDAEGAHAQARAQLDWYEAAQDAGHARLILSRGDLEDHLAEHAASEPAARRIGVVVLMEGADPVRSPDELASWVRRGVRLLGPAWRATRYCGGTKEPGGLTVLGEELVDAMTALSLPLDVSHLAEEAFWQAMARHRGPVLASHANARALTPTDRHLSDAMLDALAERDAVVGLVLGNPFLDPAAVHEPAGFDAIARQANHVAGRIGWTRLAIGSDLDGGFGREETPTGLERMGDFGRLGETVPREHRDGVLGGHWLAFLRRTLPAA
jgi:membrane dipeptidase